MKIGKTIQNKSPVVLSLLGISGFITSVIMAAKAAPKAKEILEKEPEDAPFIEQAKAVVPVYAPTAGMVLLSTACILGSNHIYRQRYSAILALYAIGEKTLSKWQDSVLEEVGKKRFGKVKEKVLSPTEPAPAELFLDDNKVLFFDSFSGRYFTSDSVETVRRIVNDLNDDLFADDFVPLNSLYYNLGLPKVAFGDNVGWNIMEGSIKVDLDAFLYNDRPCVLFSFNVWPKEY